MLHDFAALIPGIAVKGIDVSAYAVENAIEDMKRAGVAVVQSANLLQPEPMK